MKNNEYQEKTLSVGTDKQLFIGPWSEDGRDTYLVESMRNIEMTMNPAWVTGEKLMINDRPWEGAGMLDMRQFVLRDQEGFRMYYSALPYHFVSNEYNDPRHNIWKRPHRRILCYAESEDGIHWTKPNLGLYEFNSSRNNNILLPNDQFGYVFSEVEGACPFIDPAARSSDEKYKMFLKVAPVTGSDMVTDEGADDMTPVKEYKSLPKGQYAFASSDGIKW